MLVIKYRENNRYKNVTDDEDDNKQTSSNFNTLSHVM